MTRLGSTMCSAILGLALAGSCASQPPTARPDAGDETGTEPDGGGDASLLAVTVRGCWSAPIVLVPRNVWTLGKLAVLPSGDALAVWLSSWGTNRIQARLVFRDGGVGDIEEIYAAPENSISGQHQLSVPAVDTNRRGTTAVSFTLRADGGEYNEILVTTRAPDGGWQAVQRVDSTPAATSTWTGVGIDGSEALWVAWAQGASADLVPGLHARILRADSGWGPQFTVTPPETILDADAPRLDVSEAGDALLTWAGYKPGFAPELHVITLHTAPVADTLLGRQKGATALRSAMTASGEASIAWRDLGDGVYHAAHYDNGTIGPTAVVADAGFAPPSGFNTGFDAHGRATVWWSGPYVPTLLWSSHYAAGTWTPAVSQTTGNVDRPAEFIAQASNNGHALLATARDLTVLVFRDEADAGTVDTVDGVDVGPFLAPIVYVGESGARWLLAVLAEPGAKRPVAFFCP